MESVIWFCKEFCQYQLDFLVQSTMVLAVGLFFAWMFQRQGAAVRSAILRVTFVAMLLGPIATWLMVPFGFQGIRFQLPMIEQVDSRVDGNRPLAGVPVDKDSVTPGGAPMVMASVHEKRTRETTVRIDDFNGNTQQGVPSRFNNPHPNMDSSTSVKAKQTGVVWSGDESPSNDVRAIPGNSEKISTTASPIPIATSGQTGFVLKPGTWIGLFYLLNFVLWSSIHLWLIGRFVQSAWTTAWIRHNAKHATESDIWICHEIAQQMYLPTPCVLRSPYLTSPCLSGFFSPTILLPEDICSKKDLENVLVHELAHLNRFDCQWELVHRFSLCFLFFQPLLWRLVNLQKLASENVCDDHVLAYSGGRFRYANQLLELAERQWVPTNGVGMMSRGSALSQRVRRILDSGRQLKTRLSWPSIACVSVLFGSITGLAGWVGSNSGSNVSTAAKSSEVLSTIGKFTGIESTFGLEPTLNKRWSENELPNPLASPLSTQPVEATQPVAAFAHPAFVETPDDKVFTVSGRVINGGKPVADADILALPWERSGRAGIRPISHVKSDAEGKFSISFPKRTFPQAETAGGSTRRSPHLKRACRSIGKCSNE